MNWEDILKERDNWRGKTREENRVYRTKVIADPIRTNRQIKQRLEKIQQYVDEFTSIAKPIDGKAIPDSEEEFQEFGIDEDELIEIIKAYNKLIALDSATSQMLYPESQWTK